MIELLVVLVILGLVGAMSTLALTSLQRPPAAAQRDRITIARSQAISKGIAVELVVDSTTLRFLPDGRVLGGSVDPLTGELK